MVELEVQVNVVSLSAGIYILQNLAHQTNGQFCLAKNKEHLEDLMERFLVPSEASSVHQERSFQAVEQKQNTDEIEMEVAEKSYMI